MGVGRGCCNGFKVYWFFFCFSTKNASRCYLTERSQAPLVLKRVVSYTVKVKDQTWVKMRTKYISPHDKKKKVYTHLIGYDLKKSFWE